jgi:hypothetical protein
MIDDRIRALVFVTLDVTTPRQAKGQGFDGSGAGKILCRHAGLRSGIQELGRAACQAILSVRSFTKLEAKSEGESETQQKSVSLLMLGFMLFNPTYDFLLHFDIRYSVFVIRHFLIGFIIQYFTGTLESLDPRTLLLNTS